MTRLPRRTATTRLSLKAARHRWRQGVANIRLGGLSPRKHSPDGATAHIRLTGLLLIYRPRKDERLSWPSWLTCSGRFTHIVVTRRLQAERRTGSVRRPKTGILPTVLRNHYAGIPLLIGPLSSKSFCLFTYNYHLLLLPWKPCSWYSTHTKLFKYNESATEWQCTL